MISNSAVAFIYSVKNQIDIDCRVLDSEIYRKICSIYKNKFDGKSIHEFRAWLLSNEKKIYYETLNRDLTKYKDITEEEFLGLYNHLISIYKERALIELASEFDIDTIRSKGVNRAVQELERYLENIRSVELSVDKSEVSIGPDIDKTILEIKERLENPGIPGITTGFRKLDNLIKGFQPGNLVLIGGRPSVGKSTFMLNSAIRVAASGHPVLIVSRETTKQRLIMRMLSILSGVPGERMDTGIGLTSRDMNEIQKAALYLKSLPVYIDGEFSRDFYKVLHLMKESIDKNGVEVIYIDYIQLLATRSDDSNREISRISRELKLLANSTNVVVVALSQLSRNLESREDKRPVLSDLKWSGALEQDGDVIMFLYRDYLYNPNPENAKNLEVIVRKQRDGKIGFIELHYEPERFLITDEAEYEDTEEKGFAI